MCKHSIKLQHCHKYIQWAYYNFPNTFNWYLTTHMSTNDKQRIEGICRIPHPSKRNHFGIKSCSLQPQKSAFLLNPIKTCSNVELFSVFLKTFFGTNFRHQNKNNVVVTISCFVDQLSKKILRILCVWILTQ